MDPEEMWKKAEMERITRKAEKEKRRKAAQLERRAEQPLPFPGLGYSPPTRTEPKAQTPRPFPPEKRTPEPGRPTPTDDAAQHEEDDKTMRREEEHPEQQLDDEWERVYLLRTSQAPWAETRFAKYLAVESTSEPDVTPVGNKSVNKVDTPPQLDKQQEEKRERQNTNQHWKDTIAAAQHWNTKKGNKTETSTPTLSASDTRRRNDVEYQASGIGGTVSIDGDVRGPD
ncbi:hypothetical protein B0H10DRAFT_1961907 [Mycena sp. CBHHK59/15]|nr:hypothetical protein B0H10DRAFT_1961907 [Mycena sp. CBHHK59/15]